MRWVYLLYAVGVAAGACVFFAWPWLGVAAAGFGPISVGLIWAAYDLVEVRDGDAEADAPDRSGG